MKSLACAFLAGALFAHAAEAGKDPQPWQVHLGLLSLRPTAFLDAIGMSRNATTPDSVSTKFGRIPLSDSPGESLGTARHSRLQLKGELPAGRVKFSGYLEGDFMNFTSGQSPYRWRQYWGQAKVGNWEILGGQAWSLLRANRVGTDSDKDIMNTDVVDPAYHVGLLGSRVRQVRLARTMGDYKAAIAWENDGNVVAKLVRDRNRQHYEAGGFTGRFGRRGLTASAALALTAKLRLVTQQYWSKRAAYQALGVVGSGVNGFSSLEGIEARPTKNFEIYGYGGLVYAQSAGASSNRLVRQFSVGFNHKIPAPALRGAVMVSLQFSRLDRSIWQGREGAMDFVMYRMRYTFN